MNKRELIAKVAGRTGKTKTDVESILETSLEAMVEELVKGREVRLVGFGVFEVRERKARKTLDITTKKVVNVPPLNQPVFVPSEQLKKVVRGM